MKKNILLSLGLACGLLYGCSNSDDDTTDDTVNVPQLKFSAKFDPTLPRLGNLGQAVDVGDGNAAQSPVMHEVSMHYIEFAKDSLTALGSGAIVYHGTETTSGGDNAVDFAQAIIAQPDQVFTSVDLSTLPAGTYNWLRVSLTYQNYDIDYLINQPPHVNNMDATGRLASFVGFNNYVTTHTIKDSTITVNANKLQGFWAFETSLEVLGVNYGSVTEGDGAGVTVVNPIGSTSPVPVGSCVVTGKLAEPLVITGDETGDIEVVLAFSINNSFEWQEVNVDGKYEPGAGETVVDMGLRGLHPYVAQ